MINHSELQPYRYEHGQDFFANGAIQRAITRLATAERLVLFLGAGASVASGLPAWGELLQRMLVKVSEGDERFASAEQRDTWAQTIRNSKDAVAVASVLRAYCSDPGEFRRVLHDALYARESDYRVRRRGSERFLHSVWDLVISRAEAGHETAIMTLNFDDQLERAYLSNPELVRRGEALGRRQVLSIDSEDLLRGFLDDPSTAWPVIHLHGFLPEEGWETRGSEHFVLSATDFAGSWEAHWSEVALLEYLEDQWLLAGMSFQDPHVSTILRRRLDLTTNEAHPIGVLSTQGQPWRDMDDALVNLLAEAEQTRLAEFDVVALMTTFFFQDHMFLHEIGLAARPDDHVVYAERRDRWQKDSQKLTATPKKLSGVLLDLRVELESAIPPAGPEQHLKVELWIRDQSALRKLRLLASSEFRLADAGRAPTLEIDAHSPVAAVRAFTEGAPSTYNREVESRGTWRSFVAYPVDLPAEPWFGIPVASLVFGSSRSLAGSVFSTSGPAVSEVANRFMPRVATAITPKRWYLSQILPSLDRSE